MEIISILLFVMASMWTVFMVLNQVIALSTWHRYFIPYETTTKVLNLITHIILLSSIWISTLRINATATWILLIISIIPFTIWFILSRIQNRYLKDKLDKLKSEFERELRKAKSYDGYVRRRK